MPYYHLGEFEYDILITDNKEEHDEKIPDRMLNAIIHIKDTDTKITLPWILEILKRNNTTSPWDQAYHHWTELRKIFGRNENDDEKNLHLTDILKSLNRTNHIEKLERSKKIQDHILKIADALQAIKISQQNLKDVLALICIIKGISLRFKKLDQAQMDGIITNWAVYCITQIIISKTGKNRENNFSPIVDSIEKLANSSILTRRLIPKSIIPKKNVRKKFVHFKQDIQTSREDQKFNLEQAIIQSTNIDLDIKNAKDNFLEKLIHYEEERKRVTELKKVEEEIYFALDAERVLPYEARFTKIFPLRQGEKTAWENFASGQNYYYFYFISFIKKIIGYYESPRDIMNPLLQYIHREETELLKEYSVVQSSNAEYQRLKKIKVKLNLDIQSTKIAMQFKNQSSKSEVAPEEKYSFYVDLEKNNHKDMNNHDKKSIWRRYISACLKILFWTGVGMGIGFGMGTLIGTFIGGGIANIISIPFCILIGGISGFLASIMFVYSTLHKSSILPLAKNIDNPDANPSSQNIFKKLKIQPEIQNNQSYVPVHEKDPTKIYLDHKHSKQHITPIYEESPKP